ncbi:tetratricopeptide repeat protein 16 [Patella vulgata]|uniref:tetratricopeptide repeat protein 16 n=1 Tax=Patella vulgata TaxID=6465 RepID=UPI00217FF075|nr:tetratricopeptide repeat protein 16 [Patella vulgata]XP_050389166.1 tetratricopeptide repeat protein 16 [Patella vulgata]
MSAEKDPSEVSKLSFEKEEELKQSMVEPKTDSDHVEVSDRKEEGVTVVVHEEEGGDTGHQNEVEPPDPRSDPNFVNIHQFFPSLEHSFTKTSTKFAEEQDNRMEAAIKDFVAEDSTVFSEHGTNKQLALTSEAASWSTDTWGPDYNNSADRNMDSKTGDENVFATTIDEETLTAAKSKSSKSIFNTEDWPGARSPSPTFDEILINKAVEHYEHAMELKEKGDHKASIRLLSKAIALQSEDHLFYVERAENYVQLCDFQSAILNYKKACLIAPNNDSYYSRLAFLYFYLGQLLFDQRLYPESLELFSRASEMKPDNTGYHIRSISCLAALQRHGECLALVNKRLETDKNNSDLLIMRARLHEMFRNTTLCYYDVKDALNIDENHSVAKEMMYSLEKAAEDSKKQAMQLNILGKHREALQKISIAIETNPAVSSYHVLRGALHRKLGDFNSAIDDFLLALDKCDHEEDNPVYIDSQRQLLLTYNDFAVECFNKGFYEEAIILINKAIKGEKREKGLYINRGDCFLKQDELNFALQDYHQALEIDGQDAFIRTRISVIHAEFAHSAYQDKNYNEALSKMSLAIQYNPTVGGYYVSRARAKYMLEDANGARQDLILGMLLDPTNEDIVTILSRLFPGKSVIDIINSRAADAGRLALRNLMPTASPVRLQPLALPQPADVKNSEEGEKETDDNPPVVPHPPSIPKWKPEKCMPDLKMCMQEQEFNLQFAKAKKKINTKLKDSYHKRKTLKSNAPRMQPLPPSSAKPLYGANLFHRPEMIIKQTPEEKKSTNWKTFGLGIGIK